MAPSRRCGRAHRGPWRRYGCRRRNEAPHVRLAGAAGLHGGLDGPAGDRRRGLLGRLGGADGRLDVGVDGRLPHRHAGGAGSLGPPVGAGGGRRPGRAGGGDPTRRGVGDGAGGHRLHRSECRRAVAGRDRAGPAIGVGAARTGSADSPPAPRCPLRIRGDQGGGHAGADRGAVRPRDVLLVRADTPRGSARGPHRVAAPRHRPGLSDGLSGDDGGRVRRHRRRHPRLAFERPQFGPPAGRVGLAGADTARARSPGGARRGRDRRPGAAAVKRRPNPWIVVPSLIAAAVAAWLGGTVAALSCRYGEVGGTLVTLCEVGGSNLAWTVTVAILSFLVVGIGMAVVLVLVFRSIA